MEKQVKRYAIVIRGKVHNIGYRGIIESAARKMDMKGYVFNDNDRSVNIVCEGKAEYVNDFLNILKDFARADIESIEKTEIHDNFPLPSLFSRVATDEYYEFSRKFDIGLDYLGGIGKDTGEMKGTLGDIKGTLGDMKGTLGDMNGALGDMKGTLGDMKGTLGDMKGTLGDMKGTLGDMKGTLTDVHAGIGGMKGSLDSIDSALGAFIEEQRDNNKRMDKHNRHLEKILEKLAEK